MQSKLSKLLWAGIIVLGCCGCLAVYVRHRIYVGYCNGEFGWRSLWYRCLYQCSCPPSTENIRFQKLYSEDVEVMFPACESASVGPVPSPDGQKVAVMNYEDPDGFYVWFLQTDERMPFTWPGHGDLIWLSDDLLFVHWAYVMNNVVDLDTRTEYPIPVRTDVRLADGEIAPDVLSALREARYIILTGGEVAAISPDALASPERSFVISYDEFGYVRHSVHSSKQMRQFLQDQDIDYLDYIDRDGTDVLSIANPYQKYGIELEDDVPYVDLVSPDGRFFYRDSFDSRFEEGIYLVETGEKIVDPIPILRPVGWVHDGVIVQRLGRDYLIRLFPDVADVNRCLIHEPWLKLRVPAEYDVSDERTVDVSDRLPITFQVLMCFGVALMVAGGIQMLRQRKRQLSERSETQ